MIVMVIMMLVFHWHPIFVIVTGALLGIIIVKVKELMNIPVRLDHNQEKNKESIYDVTNKEMRT